MITSSTTHSRMTRTACCGATVLMLALAALAPSLAAQAATPAVTRADLAAAYLRLDRAYSAATMTDSLRASVNRQFDRASLAFFTGRFADAVTSVDSATVQLTQRPIAPEPPPSARTIRGQRPSVVAAGFAARLAAVDSAGTLAQAHVAVRARTALLVDEPSRDRSAEFLSDPATLAREIEQEIVALEAGRDPFVGRAGDRWRAFRGAGGTLVPMRVVVPERVASSATPVPVIIALHGAGGDENMFVDAYGQGLIVTLAREANAIVVSPATGNFAADPANVDTLLAILRTEHRIDESRIVVIGHSMGAGAAARLAQARPQQIAAVACLAGGSAITVADAPRALFISGALDPIAPPRSVEAAANATPNSTYGRLEHEGHTLMVGAGVRMALPWLLERRGPSRRPRP